MLFVAVATDALGAATRALKLTGVPSARTQGPTSCAVLRECFGEALDESLTARRMPEITEKTFPRTN
jgi:hypothetical protein